jgi:hypothetical protein
MAEYIGEIAKTKTQVQRPKTKTRVYPRPKPAFFAWTRSSAMCHVLLRLLCFGRWPAALFVPWALGLRRAAGLEFLSRPSLFGCRVPGVGCPSAARSLELADRNRKCAGNRNPKSKRKLNHVVAVSCKLQVQISGGRWGVGGSRKPLDSPPRGASLCQRIASADLIGSPTARRHKPSHPHRPVALSLGARAHYPLGRCIWGLRAT